MRNRTLLLITVISRHFSEHPFDLFSCMCGQLYSFRRGGIFAMLGLMMARGLKYVFCEQNLKKQAHPMQKNEIHQGFSHQFCFWYFPALSAQQMHLSAENKNKWLMPKLIKAESTSSEALILRLVTSTNTNGVQLFVATHYFFFVGIYKSLSFINTAWCCSDKTLVCSWYSLLKRSKISIDDCSSGTLPKQNYLLSEMCFI